MSEEEKKTNDEEKTIPRPEGYTIVKYAEGWTTFVVLFGGMLISPFILYLIKDVVPNRLWLFLLLYLSVFALLWGLMRKITEVKVNLKITDEGLEQTRLSGSRFYPEHRLIKWEDMKCFHPYGRTRSQAFQISVRDGMNFRICVPETALFVKQKGNKDAFKEFRTVFWEMAPDHNVHVAFFAIT